MISRVEADATHFYTFPEHDKLWKHVRSSEALYELLRQWIVGYVKLYKIHNKGKGKYAHFLVAWHELFSHLLLRGVTRRMHHGMHSYTIMMSVQHRFAIVTGVAKAVYEELTDQYIKQKQGQVDTKSVYPQAKELIPFDDASVICVSGFALHSAIEYRRELLPKSNTSTPVHPAMLYFGQALFSTVRSSLNYSSYLKSGAEVFMKSRELFETFKAGLNDIPHSSTQSPRLDGIVDSLEQGVYLKNAPLLMTF